MLSFSHHRDIKVDNMRISLEKILIIQLKFRVAGASMTVSTLSRHFSLLIRSDIKVSGCKSEWSRLTD